MVLGLKKTFHIFVSLNKCSVSSISRVYGLAGITDSTIYSHTSCVRHNFSESVSHSVVSSFLQLSGLESTRLLCPWNFPGKNTGVGSHSLLQGIFPAQGLNPRLLNYRQILFCLRIRLTPLYTTGKDTHSI